jgi:hypothetical protein
MATQLHSLAHQALGANGSEAAAPNLLCVHNKLRRTTGHFCGGGSDPALFQFGGWKPPL